MNQQAIALERSAARAMLEELTRDYTQGQIEIVGFPAARGDPIGPRHFPVTVVDEMLVHAERLNARRGINVYVSPARREGAPANGRASSSAGHVAGTRWVWLDFDGQGDAERGLAQLDACDLRPSLLVTTGTLPHLRQQAFLRLSEEIEPERARIIMKAMQRRLGSDSVHNPCRVMRLGGSIAWAKPDKPGRVDELVALLSAEDPIGFHPATLERTFVDRSDLRGTERQHAGFRFDEGESGADWGEAGPDEARELLSNIDPDAGGYRQWSDVLMALHDHFAEGGLQLAEEWSARGAKYKQGEVRQKWRSFRPGGGITFRTICGLAGRHGADLAGIARRHRARHDERRPTGTAQAWQEQASPAVELPIFPASDLADRPFPTQAWHVDGMIPAYTVTTLNGDGGTGKSLLALQLAAATALGRPWVGQDVADGPVLFLTAEDDRDQVHMRLAAVARSMDAGLADMRRLQVLTLAGKDALFAMPAPGSAVLSPTPLFRQIDAWTAANAPRLIVLDTLADLFGGQENDRSQARQFIQLLRGIAIRHRTTVLLLAHPSLTGLASGLGSSGSTAWNNSVRSRLYLKRIEVKEDNRTYEPDPDARMLTTVKANYGRTGGEVQLRWQDGVFEPQQSPSGLDRMAGAMKAERIFLKLLRAYEAQGRRVSPSPSPNYAPTRFARDKDAEGLTKHALEIAMNALFAKQKIRVEERGPSSRRVNTIVEARDHE